MLTSNFLLTLQTRYNLDTIIQVRRLTGGEWKHLYRLTMPDRALVVNLSHPSATVAGVSYEHAYLAYLHQQMPQIPDPPAPDD